MLRVHRSPVPTARRSRRLHDRSRSDCTRGTTIVEVVAALAIAGLLCGVAVPRLSRTLDGIAVRSATAAIAAACAVARSAAILRGAVAAVTIDTAGRRVTVSVGRDTVVARALEQRPYRLTLTTTRATIAYGPTGIGFGAANTSVVARQGAAADTVVTSRLGRVRH